MFSEKSIERGIGGLLGVAISSTGASFGLTEVESIISIVCSVIGLIITIVFALIIPVVKKIITAKKNDGKIDLDEAEDIINTIEQGLNEVKTDLDKKKK